MKLATITAEFVDFIPDVLQDGVVYVSDKHRIAMHRCCCGCRSEVVTPLSSVEWQLTRRGDAITMAPSIGNWAFECKSHYFIRRNQVVWAARMTASEIEAVRQRDRRDKARHVEQLNAFKDEHAAMPSFWKSLLSRLKKWFGD